MYFLSPAGHGGTPHPSSQLFLMPPILIATSEANPDCEGVQRVTFSTPWAEMSGPSLGGPGSTRAFLGGGVSRSVLEQVKFQCQTFPPSPGRLPLPCQLCQLFGLCACRRCRYRAVSEALTPISCQINTDLFRALSLLIIQRLLLSHYAAGPAERTYSPLISPPACLAHESSAAKRRGRKT